jgi:hypothetical protein
VTSYDLPSSDPVPTAAFVGAAAPAGFDAPPQAKVEVTRAKVARVIVVRFMMFVS